jgi:biopolymer transport protein TolQ
MDIRWLLSFEMTGWFSGGIYFFLMGLSLFSWALIFKKLILFRRVKRANARFRMLLKKKDNVLLPERIATLSGLFLIADTRRKFLPAENAAADREKVEEAVKVCLNEYFHELNAGLPILATISSVAPFMGLLGTVWGIMIIFSRLHGQVAGVSEMVAPGVAQALVTTIGGLLVAIPALFFYNYFTMVLRHLSDEAENYASKVIYLE